MKARFRRLMQALFDRQLQRLIARHHPRIIVVAGSIGKTSTKLAIATVLQERYRVRYQKGNFNASLGVAMTVFNLTIPQPITNPFAWIQRLLVSEHLVGKYPYDVIILEVGSDHPGDLEHELRHLRADIAVLTAVAPEHMEYFKTMEAVAIEEFSVGRRASTLVVNRQAIPAILWDQFAPTQPAPIAVGPGGQYELRMDEAATLFKNGHAVIVGLPLQVLGSHSAQAIGVAFAVGDLMGLDHTELETGLRAVRPVAGRMQPLVGLKDTQLIDDTYNSSPDAALAALETLTSLSGRHIAVLGQMNELGELSQQLHEQVGAACTKLDLLVTIGHDANTYLGPAAITAGLPEARWKQFDSPYTAGEFLRTSLETGDAVLLKGSQNGVYAEEVTKALLAEPADASRLVRQSPEWLARKRQQFGVQ